MEPHELIIAAFERAQLSAARAYHAPPAIDYARVLDNTGRANLDPGAQAAAEVSRLDAVSGFLSAVSRVREELGIEPEQAWVCARYLGEKPATVARRLGWDLGVMLDAILRWEYEMCAEMRRTYEREHTL
jgi:hypothetical protein